MRKLPRTTVVTLLTILLAGLPAAAQAQDPYYHEPPRAIAAILDAPPLPGTWLSPARDVFLIGRRASLHPPLSDLAEPMLRLAGVRVNPRNNGPHRATAWTALSIRPVVGGAERAVALPESARLSGFDWSADGRRVAFTNTRRDSLELWILDVASAAARRVDGIRLNSVLGGAYRWMPDGTTLLVKTVPVGRGPAPPEPAVPTGPRVEEASGRRGIGSTYERRDVLEDAHDEALFEYYVTSTLVFVDAASRQVTRYARPDLFASVFPSPDGEHFLVERIGRPYSHLHAYWRFPREVEIWDRNGTMERKLVSLALADQVPIHGVPTGPRHYDWRPTAPATLVYVEALDGGDPMTQVPHRDRVMTWTAPFAGAAAEKLRLQERFSDIAWTDSSGIVLLDEHHRERRWRKTFQVDLDAAKPEPRLVWDRSENEKYGDPGVPVDRLLPNGFAVIDRDGPMLYLSGPGATPSGDRPFLDRFDLRTLRAERLFRSGTEGYESFTGWLAPPPAAGVPTDRGRFLTKRESPKDPPNFYVRTLGRSVAARGGEAARASTAKPVTAYPDPTPQIRGITKRIVTYERPDGTPLSFTLYLPPGHRQGTRLPTVLWAYPLEFSDEGTAGQVSGSDQRFTILSGASPLFFLFAGYAVLDNVAMPAIGHPDSVYNSYLDQLVANARAAIDKAVALGVADRDRIGVAGHSHGAFMTANLLAHSDLFRAGIARSGAYNHTLRPFGFQSERRTLFDAPESYVRLSPMLHAHRIDEPILILHGAEDENPGTVPFQSDLLYRAVAGTGGTARLVMLPLESHGYEARESVGHALWEMTTWFDRYVKEAPPRRASGP